MNKKFILPIVLTIILASAVFVLADYEEADEYRTSITLEKGWNLVSIYSIPDALEKNIAELNKQTLDNKELKGVFIYDKYNNRYIQTYPNYDIEKMDLFFTNLQNDPLQKEYWAYTASSMWIYSNKKQVIEYSTTDGPAPINLINLKVGWNFLSITPQMVGQSFKGIKGDCKVEKAYIWQPTNPPGWRALMGLPIQTNEGVIEGVLMDDKIPQELLGRGLVFKVTTDCKLGTSNAGGSVNPPQIPN